MKADDYAECFDAITAIWRDEGGEMLDDIALMATINSVLANRFPSFFWTGFYRVCGERLVVGPYIGTVGCLRIEFGRGVCGTAANRDVWNARIRNSPDDRVKADFMCVSFENAMLHSPVQL